MPHKTIFWWKKSLSCIKRGNTIDAQCWFQVRLFSSFFCQIGILFYFTSELIESSLPNKFYLVLGGVVLILTRAITGWCQPPFPPRKIASHWQGFHSSLKISNFPLFSGIFPLRPILSTFPLWAREEVWSCLVLLSKYSLTNFSPTNQLLMGKLFKSLWKLKTLRQKQNIKCYLACNRRASFKENSKMGKIGKIEHLLFLSENFFYWFPWKQSKSRIIMIFISYSKFHVLKNSRNRFITQTALDRSDCAGFLKVKYLKNG